MEAYHQHEQGPSEVRGNDLRTSACCIKFFTNPAEKVSETLQQRLICRVKNNRVWQDGNEWAVFACFKFQLATDQFGVGLYVNGAAIAYGIPEFSDHPRLARSGTAANEMAIAVRKQKNIARIKPDIFLPNTLDDAGSTRHNMELRPTLLQLGVRRCPFSTEPTKILKDRSNAQKRRQSA